MKNFIWFSYYYYLFFLYLTIAASSNLDTSFNNIGITTHLFASYTINEALDIAVQDDGKIIAAGKTGDNGIIVRYNNDGTLDTTFNKNNTPGYIIITLGAQSTISAVKIQPSDQKIIVAGYVTLNNTNNAFIARYHYNGNLDTTFNNSGYITTIFGAESELWDLGLQADGKIIVTGTSLYNGLTHALIARYTNAGSLDTTFNTTGYVTTLIGQVYTQAQALFIQIDEKIIITGQAQINNLQQLIVLRYNTNGSLDTTFNETGYSTPLSNFIKSTGYNITLQEDQKIIIVGTTYQDSLQFNNQYYTVIRLNSNGSLDTTFNTTGYVISNIGLQAHSVGIQNNGQIITCGFNYTTNYNIIIARFNTNGSLDTTFNFTADESLNSLGNSLALQLDGKIIVTGTTMVPYAIGS